MRDSWMVHRSRLSLGALTLGMLVLSEGVIHAAPIRYEYGGVIDSTDPSTRIEPGARFTGSFTYDPDLETANRGFIVGSHTYAYGQVPGNPDPPESGFGLSLQVGDRTVLADTGVVWVQVDEIEYPGQYGFVGPDGQPKAPYTSVGITDGDLDADPLRVGLHFKNPTQSVLGSLNPPALLNLSDFPMARLSVTEPSDQGYRTLYEGTIDTLEVVSTPEPATWALFAVVAGIAWSRGGKRCGKSRRANRSLSPL